MSDFVYFESIASTVAVVAAAATAAAAVTAAFTLFVATMLDQTLLHELCSFSLSGLAWHFWVQLPKEIIVMVSRYPWYIEVPLIYKDTTNILEIVIC